MCFEGDCIGNNSGGAGDYWVDMADVDDRLVAEDKWYDFTWDFSIVMVELEISGCDDHEAR